MCEVAVANMNHLVRVAITTEVHIKVTLIKRRGEPTRCRRQPSRGRRSRWWAEERGSVIKIVRMRGEAEEEADYEDEKEDEVMTDQLLWSHLLVRDGGVGANDESKQGRVRRHPLTWVFFARLGSAKFACYLFKGSAENESMCSDVFRFLQKAKCIS